MRARGLDRGQKSESCVGISLQDLDFVVLIFNREGPPRKQRIRFSTTASLEEGRGTPRQIAMFAPSGSSCYPACQAVAFSEGWSEIIFALFELPGRARPPGEPGIRTDSPHGQPGGLSLPPKTDSPAVRPTQQKTGCAGERIRVFCYRLPVHRDRAPQ